MQCKKSQNIDALRKSFENIIIFKERLMNTWKNIIKVETQDKTVLNTKGMELTPKLSTDMVSPSQKLLFEAHSHQFLTQNSRKGFWQPRGIPGDGNGRENWEVGRSIYRESSPPTL
jgi:hypothetical protein